MTNINFKVEKFYFPSILIPSNTDVNPFFKDPLVVEEVSLWAKQNLGKVGDAGSLKDGAEILSYYFPVGENKETFVLMCKLMTFFQVLDDVAQTEKGKEKELSQDHIGRLIDSFRGLIEPKNNMEKLLVKFGVEIRSQVGEEVHKKLAIGFKLASDVLDQEKILINSIEPTSVMSLENYLAFRTENIGSTLTFAMGEAIYGLDKTDFLYGKDEQFSKLLQACSYHFLLVNDLYSFRREYYEVIGANVLYLLAYHHKLGFDEAVNVTKQNIGRYLSEFNQVKKEVLDNSPEDEKVRYIDFLSNFMFGNIKYCQESTRYHGAEVNDLVIREGGWVIMNPDFTQVTEGELENRDIVNDTIANKTRHYLKNSTKKVKTFFTILLVKMNK